MGRRDLAAWAAAVGGGGVPVSAGAAAAGDVPLQTRPDPGYGLSVLAAEHPTAVPSAYCPGFGGALSRPLRDPARAVGPSLHGSGARRAGHSLLAAGRSKGRPALSAYGSDRAPHSGP